MDRGDFTTGQGDSGAQNEYQRRAEHENGVPQAKARRGAAETCDAPTVTAPRPQKDGTAHLTCALRTNNLREVLLVAKERTESRWEMWGLQTLERGWSYAEGTGAWGKPTSRRYGLEERPVRCKWCVHCVPSWAPNTGRCTELPVNLGTASNSCGLGAAGRHR